MELMKYDYYRAMVVHPGEVSIVPTPGTMLLLASGLMGLGAAGWRRRRK